MAKLGDFTIGCVVGAIVWVLAHVAIEAFTLYVASL